MEVEEQEQLAHAPSAVSTQNDVLCVKRALLRAVAQHRWVKGKPEVTHPLVVRGQPLGTLTLKQVDAGVKVTAILNGSDVTITFVAFRLEKQFAEREGYRKYKPLENQLGKSGLSQAIRRWAQIERQDELT